MKLIPKKRKRSRHAVMVKSRSSTEGSVSEAKNSKGVFSIVCLIRKVDYRGMLQSKPHPELKRVI